MSDQKQPEKIKPWETMAWNIGGLFTVGLVMAFAAARMPLAANDPPLVVMAAAVLTAIIVYMTWPGVLGFIIGSILWGLL